MIGRSPDLSPAVSRGALPMTSNPLLASYVIRPDSPGRALLLLVGMRQKPCFIISCTSLVMVSLGQETS